MKIVSFEDMAEWSTEQLLSRRSALRGEVNDVENHRNRLKAEILFLQRVRLEQNAINRKDKSNKQSDV